MKKSIATLTYEACEKLGSDFTTKEVYDLVKKSLPNVTLRFNAIANYVSYVGVKKGLIKKIGRNGKAGLYQFVGGGAPPKKAKVPRRQKELSMAELGSAVYDHIEHLKFKIQTMAARISELEKTHRQKISEKEETIRQLNKRIRQLDTPHIRQDKTFKLSEIATFKPQNPIVVRK